MNDFKKLLFEIESLPEVQRDFIFDQLRELVTFMQLFGRREWGACR